MADDEGHWRTRAVEDFLRTVYELQQGISPVTTTQIGRRLHVTAPSVHDMIRRLGPRPADSDSLSQSYPPMPLLDHQPYHGVRLTPEGKLIALQVIRRRRLLKQYLVQKLGYGWDEVDPEADRLEHAVSERLTERLAIVLGNPQADPQGDPIPDKGGSVRPCAAEIALVDMGVGQHGVITRVADYSAELLRFLGDLGVQPGVELRVVDRSPLGDTVTVQIGSAASLYVLSELVASHLRVTHAPQRARKQALHPQPDVKAGIR